MLNRFLALLVGILAINTLQAKDNTFKPVPLWDALFGKGPIIPLEKHHQEMKDRIFSVIDPKEEKWQIHGTYPVDNKGEYSFRTSFFLVPEDFDTSFDLNKKCDQRLTIDICRYYNPMTMEMVIQLTKNLIYQRTPYATLENHIISNITDNSFIIEKSLRKEDRIPITDVGYLFGKVIKINDNLYHNYTYYQRYKPITEDQKEALLTHFHQIAAVLQKSDFKRKK